MSSQSEYFDLAVARHEVVSWLRDGALDNDPLFILGHPEEFVAVRNDEVAERFLKRVISRDFELKIFQLNETDGAAIFESRWNFCGAAIPGVAIPPRAHTYEDAKLLACAVLLRSEWCRKRFT